MGGLAAAQLAERSIQYRGMASSEQEDLLTVALVRIEEGGQVPAPAPKDYWLRVRDELVRKVIALHTTVEATGCGGCGPSSRVGHLGRSRRSGIPESPRDSDRHGDPGCCNS